jgi:hypothetical protein
MRLLVVLAAAAVAIAVAVFTGTGSASPASLTLKFIETSKGETFRFIDLRPRAKLKNGFPTRVSTGDEFVFGNTLLDAAKHRAGRIEGYCKALRGAKRFERARWGCQAFARLKRGTLSITADVKFSANGDNVAGQVTGGSGAYAGANGTFTSVGEPNAVDTFNIVVF